MTERGELNNDNDEMMCTQHRLAYYKRKQSELIDKLKLPKNDRLSLKMEIKNHTRDGMVFQKGKIINEYRPHGLKWDKSAIANLTQVEIASHILQALSFGPKFVQNADHTNMNLLSTLAETEVILQTSAGFTIDNIRTFARISLERECTNKCSDPWFDLIFEECTDFFKENQDIIALSCDKGKIVAIMNKSDYYQGLDKIINTDDYIRITDNKLKVIKSQHNAFLRMLHRLKLISEFECNRAILHSEQLPKFYGLPKLHKLQKTNDIWQTQHGVPMRPIVACCGSIGYELSAMAKNWLEKFFPPDEHNIIRIDEFVEDTKTVPINPENRVWSFDIEKMFSTIPFDKIEDIVKRKRNEISKTYDFDVLLRVLRFIAKECGIFTYKDTAYIQTKGVGMGTCISPLFARILYQDIIDETKKKLKFKWVFFRYFVDDSICVLKVGQEHTLLDAFNTYHKDIRFTMESEENNQINFLNTTVIRKENGLITNWYKKPFSSNRLVNYFSSHEKHTVTGTAISFIRTVLQLSDESFYFSNKERVIETLRDNSFPETEIIGLVNTYYTYMKNTVTIHKQDRERQYKSLPWLPNVTWKLRNQLQKYCKVHISGRPIRSTIIDSNIKDKVSSNQMKFIILKAICHCTKKIDFVYTGARTTAEVSQELLHSMNKKCTTHTHFIHKVVTVKTNAKTSAKETLTSLLAYINREYILSVHDEPALSWRNYINRHSSKFAHLLHKTKK